MRPLPQYTKPALFLASLLPLAWLIWLGLNNGLGANPIEFITHQTGTWTLNFLLITLAVTPLVRLTSYTPLTGLRRMLGLYAFFYACLHFVTYIWLDQFFDWGGMLHDIGKRPFITVGFAAFVLLWPLALTSNKAMMRKLGKHWKQLHRLVYAIALLGVVHYYWLVKKDTTVPLEYAAILLVLLAIRLLPRRSTRTTTGTPQA